MDGDVKAIELQGIVRNKTKLNVDDGQAEDLLNLRFVDGSWRTSGDGRKVWAFVYHGAPNEQVYSQIYVHTNIYRHLLGVRDGKLYWFADIATDGVTFTPKATPEELTSVTGDIWITQTGHLLTVIDEADNFEYLVFKTGDETYKKIQVDENGKQPDRGLYPFGQVHFNLHYSEENNVNNDEDSTSFQESSWYVQEYHLDTSKAHKADYYFNLRKILQNEQIKRNRFTGAFLAIAAIKLYDGTYAYCGNPILLFPNERANKLEKMQGQIMLTYANFDNEDEHFSDDVTEIYQDSSYPIRSMRGRIGTPISGGLDYGNRTLFVGGQRGLDADTYRMAYVYKAKNPPIFSAGCVYDSSVFSRPLAEMRGYDLVVSILDSSILNQYSDVFKGIGIFVTPQVQIFDEDDKGVTKVDYYSAFYAFQSYEYKTKSIEKIIHELNNSNFYLLKDIPSGETGALINKPILDLSGVADEGLLQNIVQSTSLDTDSTGRITYLPKYTYLYNGRIHIANYKTHQFHGYPLDFFHLHNHSVKVEEGSYFKGVLANLADNNDNYLQYPKTEYSFLDGTANANDRVSAKMEYNGDIFAQIIVTLNTNDGEQKVVRYIDTASITDGTGKFFEDLNPLLTFPDYRATKMQIRTMRYAGSPGYVYVTDKTFDLKPHPLYNFAYFIDPDLKPISFDSMGGKLISYNDYAFGSTPANPLVPEQNTEEYFPNGIKVSKTNNPMFFPVENTYQVGSGEILAMCSNAIAVGTGQTGAAPLYVFCTDGIYALFVDSSGEMTYTNARVIARDVLNNPRSVTPIDEGVVFTTDRGLMMIAGEQVKEIGQPAEGDVLQYADPNNPDHIKIADGALTKVADFPNSICDKTDFLTYLTGAIVNYNHNERELMISNPAKDYSYILDRNGNWSRRDYSADEYILNYPTSYRLRNGEFYKVDEEGDNNTPLEEKKEADNKFFYLSNIIKLGTVSFKQAARFVVRGFFNTNSDHIGCYVFGSYDGRKWAMLGGNEKTGTFTDIGCKIERTDVRFFRICLAGQMKGDSRIDYMEISSEPSMLNSKIR